MLSVCRLPACRELPADVFETLAALVMDTPQLAAALRAAEAAGSSAEAVPHAEHASVMQQQQEKGAMAGLADGHTDRQQEAAGASLWMAVLTSAARLLEAKVMLCARSDQHAVNERPR